MNMAVEHERHAVLEQQRLNLLLEALHLLVVGAVRVVAAQDTDGPWSELGAGSVAATTACTPTAAQEKHWLGALGRVELCDDPWRDRSVDSGQVLLDPGQLLLAHDGVRIYSRSCLVLRALSPWARPVIRADVDVVRACTASQHMFRAP